jgi:hypothetical protein
MQYLVGAVAAILVVAAVAALVVLGLTLLIAVTLAAAVVGVVAAAVFTVGFVVVAVCRTWVRVLRDDRHGHLRVAPPDPLPSGRDPGYLSYYFGPAWRDYALATSRGAAQTRERTIARSKRQRRSVLDILVFVWESPDGLEATTGWLLAKTVLGGGLVGGLLGLLTGGIVAGAIVAVTSAVFALLLGAVIGVLMMVCGVLRTVELGLLRLRGITVECPSCHRRVGVPVYECPACQALHHRLVPGSLGVLVRTCRCREELPTLLVGGRSRLRSHCSHDDCRGVLPLGGLTVPTRHVPVVAGRVAGKTVHVMAAIADLRAHADDAAFAFGDEHTKTTFEEVESRLRDVSAVPATLPTAPLRAATFFLGTGPQRRLMYVYDAAGESYQSSDRVSGLRFLGAAAGVLLVVDPFALPSVRRRMLADEVSLPNHSTEPPGDIVGRFTAGLREHGARLSQGRVTVPVALVLTKCDVFVAGGPVRHPYEELPVGIDGAALRRARSAAVVSWLDDEAGEGGLVRQLGTDYTTIAHFAVSALDGFSTVERVSGRTGRPVCHDPPSAPLRWLLDSGKGAG